jgi:hypothetical protein
MGIPKYKPKYRSGLEHLVAVLLERASITALHEKETLKYLQPSVMRRYLVDFTFPENPALIVEVKGRFTGADRKKMLLVKEQHPTRKLVMLFGKSSNKLSKNSPTTYADWCDKNDIAWIDITEFKENPKCLFTITKKKDGLSKSLPKTSKKRSKKLVSE